MPRLDSDEHLLKHDDSEYVNCSFCGELLHEDESKRGGGMHISCRRSDRAEWLRDQRKDGER